MAEIHYKILWLIIDASIKTTVYSTLSNQYVLYEKEKKSLVLSEKEKESSRLVLLESV